MKTFKYIFIILVGLVWSCDDFLDTPPKSQISLGDFWKTKADAQLGVAAIYNAVQNAMEQDFWTSGELRADNYIVNDRPAQSSLDAISNRLTITTNGTDWSQLYRAIAHANVAIERIPQIPAFDTQNDLLAQALTLRALLYFYAVRVWGDVPKVTQIVSDVSSDINAPRAPLTAIYNEIILPDLQQAESLIQINTNRNFISKGSILALKAHVYAWPGAHQDYQKTVNAITALQNLGYKLETTQQGWKNIFQGGENSNEIIFWLAWNFAEDGSNGGIGQFAGFTPDKVPAETLATKWKTAIPDDFRILQSAAFNIEITNPDEFPFLRILSKFLGVFTDRNAQQSATITNDKDIPIFRLSELILLKAEAQNALGNGSDALILLNSIRTARALPLLVDGSDVVSSDQTTMRDLILNERQFELMGEGHRFWDLVRNGVAVEVMSQVTDLQGNINGLDKESEILWPIAQNVLNRNPNIEQNEAYK